MQSKEHWEHIYRTKPADGVSWYQEHASSSLRIIRSLGLATDASIIDVGGGASTLVDDLLQQGYGHVTVLDLSEAALVTAQQRLRSKASLVDWIEGDITEVPLPAHSFDLWHDRAVFHFLTTEGERHSYLAKVMRAVKPGGYVIVGTFAADGPTHCSGLPVMRYSASDLHDEFGDPFELLGHQNDEHLTPFGTIQKFVYCYCRKVH